MKQGTQTILDLYARSGQADYIGEPVSQLEHALQCGFFARKAGATNTAVLAALLHDIGHICAPPAAKQMDDLGVVDHETIGGEYLHKLGFSRELAALVAGHVQAKRYLVQKNPSYRARLSEASKRTLEFQGGPMSPDEAQAFERDPHFKTILAIRQWDEQAKVEGMEVPGLESYRPLLDSNLNS